MDKVNVDKNKAKERNIQHKRSYFQFQLEKVQMVVGFEQI